MIIVNKCGNYAFKNIYILWSCSKKATFLLFIIWWCFIKFNNLNWFHNYKTSQKGLHGGEVVSSVASQREGPAGFGVEPPCSSRVCVGFLPARWPPPAVQKHASQLGILQEHVSAPCDVHVYKRLDSQRGSSSVRALSCKDLTILNNVRLKSKNSLRGWDWRKAHKQPKISHEDPNLPDLNLNPNCSIL